MPVLFPNFEAGVRLVFAAGWCVLVLALGTGWGFTSGSEVKKKPTCQWREAEFIILISSILAWRIPWTRGAWWTTVHEITKSQCPISSLGGGIEEYRRNLKAQRDSQIQKASCQIGKKAKVTNAKYWGEI